MISLVVCSSSPQFFTIFSKSVSDSIGCSHEIIKIDNLDSKYSITQAYDLGASKAIGEFLLFVHEDVVFHSQNWGVLLINYFKTLINPGVIGIAGSSYLPISPSDWWLSDRQYLHSYFLSNKKDGIVGEGVLTTYGDQSPRIVFALDGMFLAIKKNIYQEFSFDTSLSGFHGYDTAICYQVSQKYHNYFVPGILLEHFSKGYPNSIWLRNTILANSQIWSYLIKLKSNGGIDPKLELKAYQLFLSQLYKYGSSFKDNLNWSWLYFKKVSRFTFQLGLVHIFIKYLLAYFLQKFGIDSKKRVVIKK